MEATVTPSALPADAARRLPGADLADQYEPLAAALAWVRDNQYPAMIGAFAIGVFLGVLARR